MEQYSIPVTLSPQQRRILLQKYKKASFIYVWNRGRERIINLTSKEFDILALLIANPKRVFTYELITDLVWKEDCDFYSRKAIHNHMSKLRKKLRFEPDLPNYIESVAGIGYKFEHL